MRGMATKTALEQAYRAYATKNYHEDGYIEFDASAPVRVTPDGAYVQGWIFISGENINVLRVRSAARRESRDSDLD